MNGQHSLQEYLGVTQAHQDYDCNFNAGHVKQWIMLEIVGFAVNMIVSAFHISLSYFSTASYRKSAVEANEKRVDRIACYIHDQDLRVRKLIEPDFVCDCHYCARNKATMKKS